MKKVSEATIEEIVKDITTKDDIDSALTIHYNRHDKFVVMSVDGSGEVWADTLRVALIKFFIEYAKLAAYHYDLDTILDYQSLDWTEEV